jgi:hypothetical protein
MNKICTSIVQSKELIELGIDVNTADMYWWNSGERYYCETRLNKESDNLAWSLSALLELIPPYLGEFKDGIDFGFSKAMNSKWYSAHYIKFNDNGLASFNKTVTGDTAIDAAFEMVVWLKKNKKI